MRTICAALLLLVPALAQAHVSITPRSSTAGATEKALCGFPQKEESRPGFLRYSFAANTALMTVGFMLIGYQLAGYFQS